MHVSEGLGVIMLIQRHAAELQTLVAPPIALAIAAWLDAKSKRSGSAKTARAYADAITDFRAVLISAGLDLDSDPRPVSLDRASLRWQPQRRTSARRIR